MVRMAVSTVRAKRHNDVGLDDADESRDLPLRLDGIRTVEVSVDVIEKMNLANPQLSACRSQLGLTHFAHNFKRRSYRGITKAASLAPRSCDEKCFDALFGVSGESPTHSQRFIVGMCKNAHQPQTVSHFSLLRVREQQRITRSRPQLTLTDELA